jgi:hypothetical protein
MSTLSSDPNDLDYGHTWVPADKVIKWPHCSVCLIIQRADGTNKPCKGPGRLRPMEPQRKAYSDPKGGPEYDAP